MAEKEKVTFISKGAGFRAVIKPSRRQYDRNGEQTGVTEGKTADFAPTGRFTTDDPEIIKHLRGLNSFNREFYEQGAEPERVPDPAPLLDRIVQLSIELDLDGLREIEAEEVATHSRDVVLSTVRGSIGRLETLQANAGAAAPGTQGT